MATHILSIVHNNRTVILRNLNDKLFRKYCGMIDKTGMFRIRVKFNAGKKSIGITQYVDKNMPEWFIKN